MPSLTVRIPAQVHDRLHDEANARRLSVSERVRNLLDAYDGDPAGSDLSDRVQRIEDRLTRLERLAEQAPDW